MPACGCGGIIVKEFLNLLLHVGQLVNIPLFLGRALLLDFYSNPKINLVQFCCYIVKEVFLLLLF